MTKRPNSSLDIASAPERKLSRLQTGFDRIASNVLPKIVQVFEAANGVIEILFHPKRPLLALDLVDFPSAMPFPAMQEIFELPMSKRSHQDMNVIWHHYEIADSTSFSIEEKKRLGNLL
jgi:hypothetical protein